MTHHLSSSKRRVSVTWRTFSELDFDIPFFPFLFLLLFFSPSLSVPIYVILEDHVTLTLSRHFPLSVLFFTLDLCESEMHCPTALASCV
ncbi:hypothetical protein BDW75DRAFT_138672 [Aspergillus navahoensis]